MWWSGALRDDHRPPGPARLTARPAAGGAYWVWPGPAPQSHPDAPRSTEHCSTQGDTAPGMGTPLPVGRERCSLWWSGVRVRGAVCGVVERCPAGRPPAAGPGSTDGPARPTARLDRPPGRPLARLIGCGPARRRSHTPTHRDPRNTAPRRGDTAPGMGTPLPGWGHRSRDGDTAPGRAGAVFGLVERRSGPRSGVRCGGALPCGTTTGRRARLDRRRGLARPTSRLAPPPSADGAGPRKAAPAAGDRGGGRCSGGCQVDRSGSVSGPRR